MTFRITPPFQLNRSLLETHSRNERIADLQLQISTGVRITRPSDDPIGAGRALSLKFADARFEADLSAIAHVRGTLNESVSQLVEANTLLTRAEQVAVEAAQPGLEGSREIHAVEIDALIDRLLAIANTTEGGRYLYGGDASDRKPFVEVGRGPEGGAERILYRGSERAATTLLGRSHSIELFLPGSNVFQSIDRQESTFTGPTGAAPAPGVDNGIGRALLSVTHETTTYDPGAGIAPGADTHLDTVIGPPGANTLRVTDTSGDGSSGLVSLNGGAEIPFTNASTNLAVPGPNGQRVYVDLSGVAPGFDGEVGITATGTLSIDAGVTTVPIEFTERQTLVHSETGYVTGVDSSQIRMEGETEISYVGTQDVFATLIAIRDTLRSPETSSEELQDRLTDFAGELGRHSDRFLAVVGEQSSALESLESMELTISNRKLENLKNLGDIENTDLGAAVIQLQQEQNFLEYTYASLARSLNQNLFDFVQ